MLPVSNDFKTAIDAPVRRIVPRVMIDYTGNFVDKTATVQTSGTYNSVVTPAFQAINGKTRPNKKRAAVGSFKLDGTFKLFPSQGGEEVGWWSADLCDASGVFVVPQTIEVSFQARSIKKIWFYAEELLQHYPVDFTVEYYDGAWHTAANVTGHNSAYYECELPDIVTNVTKVKLTVTKMNKGNIHLKIVEFDASLTETYEGDDVLYLSVLEEMEGETGSLPIGNISSNEMSIKVNNIDRRFFAENQQSNLYGQLRNNRRVRAELGIQFPNGEYEYVPVAPPMWTGDWVTPSDDIAASTTARDRMELLRQTPFSTSQVYENKSLYELAEIILQDAGLDANEYWIDPDLQNTIIPYAWFEPTNHREALRRIVEAAVGRAWVDREGIIRVAGYNYLATRDTPVATLTDQNQIFKADNPLMHSRVANWIEVKSKPLKPDTFQDVYSSPEAITVPAGGSKTLTLFFDKQPVVNVQVPVLSGATNTVVQSYTAYAWGMDITLQNTGGTDENVTITIQGQPLIKSGGITAIAKDDNSIADNGKLKYTLENDFIQSLDLAQQIADNILAVYANPSRDVELDIRGNFALEVADRIKIIDAITSLNHDIHIYRQQLEYDGGLKARISGRKAV